MKIALSTLSLLILATSNYALAVKKRSFFRSPAEVRVIDKKVLKTAGRTVFRSPPQIEVVEKSELETSYKDCLLEKREEIQKHKIVLKEEIKLLREALQSGDIEKEEYRELFSEAIKFYKEQVQLIRKECSVD